MNMSLFNCNLIAALLSRFKSFVMKVIDLLIIISLFMINIVNGKLMKA